MVGQSKESADKSGTVIRSTGSWYEVLTDQGIVSCTVRGRFRLERSDVTNPVVVGDRVGIRMNKDETGLIVDVYERRNRLTRRAAGRRVGKEHIIVSNIDFVWIIQSVLYPKINPGFIDRLLVMAALYDIEAGLVINKTDLIEDEFVSAIEFWEELYCGLGYPVLRTSAKTGEGVDALAERLGDLTSVVIGPSGVGKSSLLNRIEPGLQLRMGDISKSTLKGTHTTTFVALYPLSSGGFVADTPGLREYGLIDLTPEDLAHYFVEFDEYRHACRYSNCTHDHEPGCRIVEAVESEDIATERDESYLNMLNSLRLGDKDVGR